MAGTRGRGHRGNGTDHSTWLQLQNHLEALEWTQQRLAERTGYHRNSVLRWRVRGVPELVLAYLGLVRVVLSPELGKAAEGRWVSRMASYLVAISRCSSQQRAKAKGLTGEEFDKYVKELSALRSALR